MQKKVPVDVLRLRAARREREASVKSTANMINVTASTVQQGSNGLMEAM